MKLFIDNKSENISLEFCYKRDIFLNELFDIISTQIEEPAGRGCGYGIRSEGIEEIYELISRMKITFGD